MTDGKPEGNLSEETQKNFQDANVAFRGCILSVLSDRLCDVYMHIEDGKELWDALDAKFGATDAASELYTMESLNDYKMVDNRSVVEQAHEIHIIVRELNLLKCDLPDKYVVVCIIAKLSPAWRNFATSLKHKRQEISVEQLIEFLDVEEKARAKDTTEKAADFPSNANMVQRNLLGNGKNKGKKFAVVNNNKPADYYLQEEESKQRRDELLHLWRARPLF